MSLLVGKRGENHDSFPNVIMLREGGKSSLDANEKSPVGMRARVRESDNGMAERNGGIKGPNEGTNLSDLLNAHFGSS